MKKCLGFLAALILQFDLAPCAAATTDQPLTTLDYHVVGIGLQASPEYQAVPKGLATQVVTGIDAQGFDVAGIIAQRQDFVRCHAAGGDHRIDQRSAALFGPENSLR